MIRYRWYVGQRDKDGALGAPAYRAMAEERLRAAFGGFTRYKGHGEWLDASNGEVYIEPSYVYEVCGESPDLSGEVKLYDVRCSPREASQVIGAQLRDILKQSAVLATFEEIQGEFV